jgi:hypothetical protein
MSTYYPPTSGQSALVLGLQGEPGRAELLFDFPVKDIRFSVRPLDNVTIECFNEVGVRVAGRTVSGEWNNNGWWLHYGGQPPVPIPLHAISLDGKGIRRCTLAGAGGMLDDLRYSRDLNELDLSCEPAVLTRGAETECTATLDGGPSDWKPTSWKFIAPSESVAIERVANVDQRIWKGKMVLSGSVIVTTQLGGKELADTFDVTVEGRNWDERAPAYSFTKIPNGTDPRLTLPTRIDYSDDLGSANWFPAREPGSSVPDYTDQVLGGPNDALMFFKDETNIDFYGYYTLNTAAMIQGSAFYRQQEEGSSGSSAQYGGPNWCSRSVVTSSLPGLVEQHELYHGEVYERVLRENFSAAMTRLESTVGPSSDLYDAYDNEWSGLDDLARTASFAIHKQNGSPGRVTPSDSRGRCNLKNEAGALLQHRPETTTTER